MLQLKNTTPFAANLAVFPDAEGIDTLYINVKASFTIGQQWTLAKEQSAPQAEDLYWGEPAESSLKYASDYHTGKPATDIVMLGHACAPGQSEVSELDVSLKVASLRKTVRVFGDRVWRNGRISPPTKFQRMPLVYERAFGGAIYTDGAIAAAEERNPVGLGFKGNRKESDMEGQPLPNLEAPSSLIRSPSDQPEPACFGFRAPNWQPRAGFAGTYDANWVKERAPYLPFDYDNRFLNAAHPDLIADGFLQGGEGVEITNMHPDGSLSFNLPRIRLVARVNVAGTFKTPGFNLETVILEPNDFRVSLVWKASLRCDKNILKVRDVSLALSRQLQPSAEQLR